MKTKLNPIELAPLADFINNCYDGNLARISNDLDKAVYLLHLVKKDEVDPDKIEKFRRDGPKFTRAVKMA